MEDRKEIKQPDSVLPSENANSNFIQIKPQQSKATGSKSSKVQNLTNLKQLQLTSNRNLYEENDSKYQSSVKESMPSMKVTIGGPKIEETKSRARDNDYNLI